MTLVVPFPTNVMPWAWILMLAPALKLDAQSCSVYERFDDNQGQDRRQSSWNFRAEFISVGSPQMSAQVGS